MEYKELSVASLGKKYVWLRFIRYRIRVAETFKITVSMILLKLKLTFFLRKGKKKNCSPKWCFIFIFLKKDFLKLLAVLHGMWDLSSPTRDQTHTLCSGSIES